MRIVREILRLDPGGLDDERIFETARRVRDRAERLYRRREALCSEAVLLSLNSLFQGGLTDEQAVSLAAGFSMGLGESGCLCGAVGGAAAGLGLLMGQGQAAVKRSEIRNTVRNLHAEFNKIHGSACCRILSKPVRHDPKAHFSQCVGLTGDAAEFAARLLLTRQPDLLELFAATQAPGPSKPCGWWRRLANRLLR